jgi:hypothetical protein
MAGSDLEQGQQGLGGPDPPDLSSEALLTEAELDGIVGDLGQGEGQVDEVRCGELLEQEPSLMPGVPRLELQQPADGDGAAAPGDVEGPNGPTPSMPSISSVAGVSAGLSGKSRWARKAKGAGVATHFTSGVKAKILTMGALAAEAAQVSQAFLIYTRSRPPPAGYTPYICVLQGGARAFNWGRRWSGAQNLRRHPSCHPK